MENNQVTDLRTSAIPQEVISGWKEDIEFQVALQASPHTLESSESLMDNRKSAAYLIRIPGGVAAIDDRGMWVIEMNSDEPPWRYVEIDPNSAYWSKKLHFTPAVRVRNFVWGNALELATTPDIAVDDSKQLHRPLQDLQAEEMLGIFTISRSPNVIFTKSIQLTSSLEKRKPYISPYGILPNEEE